MDALSLAAIIVIVAALAIAWSKRFIATGAIVIANLIVFGMTALGPRVMPTCAPGRWLSPAIHQDLGLCPGHIYDPSPLAALQAVTSMFVHADLFHLVGNVIILLAFAVVFEEFIGPRKFLFVYLTTGVFAAISQILASWGSTAILIGASGAVFGIIGAFAGMYPNMILRLPLPLPIIIFVRMRVLMAALLFGLMQILLTFLSSAYDIMGNVAFAAHIGGLIGGFALGTALRRTVDAPTEVKVVVAGLDRFASDSKAKRALAEMEANKDVPEIYNIWAERFWEHARDPTTGQPVSQKRGRIVREDGTDVTP